MREADPVPDASRYATLSLTPWTSRNWSVSAPATTPVCQVLPPSVVTANLPSSPLAQTTRASTGLTACRRLVVPLVCGVSTGAAKARAARRQTNAAVIAWSRFMESPGSCPHAAPRERARQGVPRRRRLRRAARRGRMHPVAQSLESLNAAVDGRIARGDYRGALALPLAFVARDEDTAS